MLIDKFNEILKCNDPFDLCNGVFCLFSEKYGNQLDVANEPEPSRSITLVWHSLGLIGNGGFSYLFAGQFNGDPDFRITAESYKNIGAEAAYNKFCDALEAYSSRTFVIKLKSWFMNSILGKESENDTILNQCFGDDEQEMIQNLLLTYIKHNELELRKQLNSQA